MLYFCRYVESIVEKAHALQTITMEQYARILQFYEEDIFVIAGQEGVDSLRSFIPHLEQTCYDSSKDLYFMKVKEWPHLKFMCLKCAPSNPCIWKYFTEQDEELFEYRIDTFSILCPSSMLAGDSFDSSGHGTN
ncbi:uncharacterized protein TNCT_206351 [Trichonephila clavata]|uniref:Uncharacterized protein n=1 Tax=Trichonephila clavata TaxID=2740835 RepID=A0A8X6HKG8_TRICU|nr:uncharacterized protein TNCT_206351 [Trichonephila clavata]